MWIPKLVLAKPSSTLQVYSNLQGWTKIVLSRKTGVHSGHLPVDLNLPSFCILKRKIENTRARDINFKLASKLKSELDMTIDILVNANHKSPK